jgi:hypothetical protein
MEAVALGWPSAKTSLNEGVLFFIPPASIIVQAVFDNSSHPSQLRILPSQILEGQRHCIRR